MELHYRFQLQHNMYVQTFQMLYMDMFPTFINEKKLQANQGLRSGKRRHLFHFEITERVHRCSNVYVFVYKWHTLLAYKSDSSASLMKLT